MIEDNMSDPIVGFRFEVSFLVSGIRSNPVDMRFQKVSGLAAKINTEDLREGGQNLYTQKLPTDVSYDNLVLERGMVVRSSGLNGMLEKTMSSFIFAPSNVQVTLLNEQASPLMSWLFMQAYPVKWSTSDLDAEPSLLIDTIELAYTFMKRMKV
jgi:phage tail-like protein